MTRPIFMPVKLHGINFDLQPEDVPETSWTGGRNVFFKNGETWRCEGINKVFETGRLFPADFVHYVDMGLQEWWIYGSGAGIGVTDGAGNHYNITPVGWGPISGDNLVYSIGDLNTLPWVNHPELGPYWWDGLIANKMVKLPDWPTGWACRAMASHKNFLFAMAITLPTGLAESQVSWSSSADPGLVPEFWVPSPTNDAGDFTFATPGGPIIGGIGLRDQFFVSKADATYAAQYVGGQWVFQARDLFQSTGMFAPHAAIEHDQAIYMLSGAGRFVRHDGNSLQSLLYGVAEDYLSNAINQQWPSSVFFYKTDNGNVLACAYPTGTSKLCTEAIGIEVASIGNPEGIDVGLRDLPGVLDASIGYTTITPQSWDSDSQAWNDDATIWNEQASGYRPVHTVFGGVANGMLELGLGNDVLGVPIVAYAERLGKDVGEFGSHKVISGAFPQMAGSAGNVVTFRFGSQEQVHGSVNWGTDLPATIGTTQQLDFFQDGRLLAVSVRSNGGAAWRLNGLQLMVRKGGRW
jgi:hypothetical protein